MNTTRATLIERVKDPENEEAWEAFCDAYADYINAVLHKVGISHDDVIDLRQDILLKLWKILPGFDYQTKKGKFRTWLYQVIRNVAYTSLSAKKSEQDRIDRYFKENIDGSDGIKELMDEQWKAYICERALKNISKSFNMQSIEIFNATLRGQPIKDLAEKYKLKENTVHRIKNRVKESLVIEIQRLRSDLE